MATVAVKCPNPACPARYRAEESELGRKFKCEACGTPFVLARVDTPPTAPSVPPAPPRNPATPAAARPRGDDGIPLTWQPGDVILDLYEVRPLREGLPFAEGGMGRVNRVWHRQWQTHLAVKSVHPGRLKSTQAVEDFKREAEEWVNRIGLHPHVVSCFYVRILGGLPRVFVEFVDGGSLADWIKMGQLYEGGPEQALRRMLDVAIQFAWGLHYVHELGMIHQDVKPLNVMMTADGIAKVTDFGLANARAKAFGEEQEPPAGRTVLATYGGMTPAYCSPEQAAIQAQRKAGTPLERLPKLTRRTDVWSWAVSVLEMFLGKLAWPSGSVAHIGLKRDAEDPRIPKMPAAVRELLQQCLHQRPDDRPHDLKEVADSLREIYQQVTGERYQREMPRATEAVADTLNNRAVSLLDLGKSVEAERLWEQALKTDLHHIESTYNLGLIRWRSGRTDDLALVRQLAAIRDSALDSVPVRLCLGHVHLERGDCAAAIQELEGVTREAAGSGEVTALLVRAREGLPLSRRCLHTFEGHTDAVYAVSLSGDARLAISGSGDETAKLWETSSGRCLHTFQGHAGPVWAVSLSGDGRLALSGGKDKTVKVWETWSGRCLHTYEGHTDCVMAVSLSGDGRLSLSGSNDRTVRLWETDSGRCRGTLRGHAGEVKAVDLSADGRLALSGGRDDTVKLWETKSGRCLRTFAEHPGWVSSVGLSADGRLAFTGSFDRAVRLWETDSGRFLRAFVEHPDRVTSVGLSTDGRLALSGSSDRTVRLWETDSGRCLRTFAGHSDAESEVSHGESVVSLSGDGRLALSVGRGKTIKMWQVSWQEPFSAPLILSRLESLQKMFQAQRVHNRAVEQARKALSQGETLLAAQHLRCAREQSGYHRNPQSLALWRECYLRLPRRGLRGAYLLHTFQGHTDQVLALSLSGDARLALSGSADRTVKLWETDSGRCLATLREHTDKVTAVGLSADGRLALSGSHDRMIKLWETGSGRCLRTFEGHKDGVCEVSLSADGKLILSGSTEVTTCTITGSVKLWETSSGRCLHTFESHWGGVCAVSLSADGRLALSVPVSGGKLKLWQTASGRCLRTFEVERRGPDPYRCVHAAILSANGRLVLAGLRSALRLWEVSSGRCLRTIEGHQGDGHASGVTALSLSSDGSLALSGSQDRTVKLWETSVGHCLHTFHEHTQAVNAVSLSGDGCLALSGSDDKTVNLWFLDWELEEVGDARPWWKRLLGLDK